MTQPVNAVLLGAGHRGAGAYAPYALRHPDRLRFVAVAEPNPERRRRFANQYKIAPENQFETWEDLLDRPQLAEAALICTQDRMHTAPTVAALQAGYHVLLEKPMAPTAEECRLLISTSQQTGRQLHVCHVLRYTPHFQEIRAIIQSGVLGDIVNVSHRENVAWWHAAHSYVRGNWANSQKSAPMILAKSCHDFDILLWILDQSCDWLSSTGSLLHFRPENAPEGAPEYCLDGCPAANRCLYYAPWIYVDMVPLWRSFQTTSHGFPHWIVSAQLRFPRLLHAAGKLIPPLKQVTEYKGSPRSVVADDPTPENLLEALRRGPYGRCAYHCDNDAVDNQIVAMHFSGGTSVTHTMHSHSHFEGRTTRIEGTRGTLKAQFALGGSWIDVDEHFSDRHRHIDTSGAPGDEHGGGDDLLVAAFVNSVRSGGQTARTLASQALDSHLMAFAAEQARLEQRVVHLDELRSGDS